MRRTQTVAAALLAVLACCPQGQARDLRIEENEPPQISHFPPGVGYRGQPIPIVAKVTDETGKIRKVSLFYALSQQQVPLEVRMKRTGDGKYSGLIPANFFASMSKVWYFIEARDSFDDKGETTWYPVLIQDPGTGQVGGEGATAAGGKAAATGTAGSGGTAVPADAALGTADATGGGMSTGTKIGIGALAAGGVALAVGGGGGGGDDDGGGGGSGFDPNNAVVVNANGSAAGGFSSGPQDTLIDGSAQVAGRTVTGVRVTLNYDGFTIPDQFQIIYEGNTIADSGSVSGSGTIQGTDGGTSAQVTIRVITDSGDTAWNWNATLEISVE